MNNLLVISPKTLYEARSDVAGLLLSGVGHDRIWAMPPSDFANVDIDEVLDNLSTEDAVKLIAGVGFWHTASIERLGIPAIKVRLLLR